MSDSVLEMQGTEAGYGRQPILHAMDLRVARGQWLGLLGPNASGKTTLLRCAAGLLPPARGEVRIAGRALYPLREWTGTLPGFAIPPQDLPPFLSSRQCLEIYAGAHGIAAVPARTLALCEELGLAAQADKLTRNVSLGTRQKLAIVLALMTDPPLLVLDEVFNGLDFGSALTLKRHLRQRVQEEGLSVLLATHALDVVMGCCDSVALLDSGRLVHTWDARELRACGDGPGLERAMAAALRGE